jgi:hypothetical protein
VAERILVAHDGHETRQSPAHRRPTPGRGLEIGTSTGHSGVWVAWALAKTGGKLTTVEIDPQRPRTAVANVKEPGLSSFIDARLGDAHQIVPALAEPFDFVFSDPDKDWYKNYFVTVWAKVSPGHQWASPDRVAPANHYGSHASCAGQIWTDINPGFAAALPLMSCTST